MFLRGFTKCVFRVLSRVLTLRAEMENVKCEGPPERSTETWRGHCWSGDSQKSAGRWTSSATPSSGEPPSARPRSALCSERPVPDKSREAHFKLKIPVALRTYSSNCKNTFGAVMKHFVTEEKSN